MYSLETDVFSDDLPLTLLLNPCHYRSRESWYQILFSSLGYHLDECWLVALRLVAFHKIWKLVVEYLRVEKSNMQMSKCHLHKCQTSLGWVHKLVTHPSNIPDCSVLKLLSLISQSFHIICTRRKSSLMKATERSNNSLSLLTKRLPFVIPIDVQNFCSKSHFSVVNSKLLGIRYQCVDVRHTKLIVDRPTTKKRLIKEVK